MLKSVPQNLNVLPQKNIVERGIDLSEGDIGEAYDYTPESDVESLEEDGPADLNNQEFKGGMSDVAADNVPLGKLQLNDSAVEKVVVPTEQVCVDSSTTATTNATNGAAADANATNPNENRNASADPTPLNNNKPLPPGTSGPVEGFQLVQATGLTDTSTPAPRGSSIPDFATPSPLMDFQLPTATGASTSTSMPPAPGPVPPPPSYNPLVDDSKSKQFTARTDYMIAEFFSRQVARLTRGAPEALDRSYRIFQQRFKERLGAQWAHITSQPEVEEAIKRVQDMYDYFESLEKIVRKQRVALQKMNDIELELALWYRKEGVSEPSGSIRDNMLHLAASYQDICRNRGLLISAYEQYADFLHTFQKKAIGDALDTMKKQHTSRLELDAYGSKLGQLEEKKLKTFARAPSPSESASLEKELGNIRSKFQDAKQKYQNYSTSLIDKAGLLDLKKGVDFAAHIQKIREVHDTFNRERSMASSAEIPEEDAIEYDEHGLPVSK